MTPLLYALGLVGLSALALYCRRLLDARQDMVTWRQLAIMSRSSVGKFELGQVRDLPEAAQRYFAYTIAPGTAHVSALEIQMTGELGLGSRGKPNYRPMVAEQILAPPHGLVWRLKSGPVSGSDGAAPATSWTRFWLYGLMPIVRAGGNPDHLRSAFGRVVSEGAFWVPSSLLPSEIVTWQHIDASTARATVRYGALSQAIDISVADDGQPTQVVMQRWSNANPEQRFTEQPFGGYLSQFVTFSGYRLPTRVEGGNFPGTEDYFPFYKARVTGFRIPEL